MKILFAGTPEFAVAPLLRLIETEHQIVGVYTQPDRKAGRGKKITPPPVKVTALQHNIPVFQPVSLKDQAETIQQLQPDVMVVVAYGMLLPQQILDLPPLGCINIHASVLPRWRGAAPIQRALEAGDQQTGVSIMKMELGLDTGPVYQVLTTDISQEDTSGTLHDRLSMLGAEGICSTLARLATNPSIPPIPQNDSDACYAKKISKDEAIINWEHSAEEIERRIRAFIPWPVCQSYHNQTRIRVWQASVLKSNMNNCFNQQAGEVVALSDNGLDIQCGSGIIRLTVLQRDGSKPLTSREFCNGYSIAVGDRFNIPPK